MKFPPFRRSDLRCANFAAIGHRLPASSLARSRYACFPIEMAIMADAEIDSMSGTTPLAAVSKPEAQLESYISHDHLHPIQLRGGGDFGSDCHRQSNEDISGHINNPNPVKR